MMATESQARDGEIDRALIGIRQRMQQMELEWEKHPVDIQALVRQTEAQSRLAFATVALAAATFGGVLVAAIPYIRPLFHQ
jgi:hypothetical protein